MSSFRRLSNLAKGLFSVEKRRWTEGEPAEPEEVRDAARVPPPAAKSALAAPPPAPEPAPTPPERDESGEVKRTL